MTIMYEVVQKYIKGSGFRFQCKFNVKVMSEHNRVVKKRMEICANCAHVTKSRDKNGNLVPWKCKLCDCLLPCKTRVSQLRCPHDPPHWDSVSMTIEGVRE